MTDYCVASGLVMQGVAQPEVHEIEEKLKSPVVRETLQTTMECVEFCCKTGVNRVGPGLHRV